MLSGLAGTTAVFLHVVLYWRVTSLPKQLPREEVCVMLTARSRKEATLTRTVTSMSTTKARFHTDATPGCSNRTVDTMWCIVALTPLRDSAAVLAFAAPSSGVSEGVAAGLASEREEADVGAAALPAALLAAAKHIASCMSTCQ